MRDLYVVRLGQPNEDTREKYVCEDSTVDFRDLGVWDTAKDVADNNGSPISVDLAIAKISAILFELGRQGYTAGPITKVFDISTGNHSNWWHGLSDTPQGQVGVLGHNVHILSREERLPILMLHLSLLKFELETTLLLENRQGWYVELRHNDHIDR